MFSGSGKIRTYKAVRLWFYRPVQISYSTALPKLVQMVRFELTPSFLDYLLRVAWLPLHHICENLPDRLTLHTFLPSSLSALTEP